MSSWEYLAAAQAAPLVAPDKTFHVFLTTVYAAPHVSGEMLDLGLEVAAAAAGGGDAVAAYRVVSLLRRAGRPAEGFAALEEACALLASGTVAPLLADHLSERLVAERALLSEVSLKLV